MNTFSLLLAKAMYTLRCFVLFLCFNTECCAAIEITLLGAGVTPMNV